jgi:Flp pilus assembly protein TadD
VRAPVGGAGKRMKHAGSIARTMMLAAALAVGACASLPERPSDAPLRLGKEQFERRNFGLAEVHFRAAVEANPQSIESWVGLAASYDRLHRFDLAERAYNHAIELGGKTPELLNNLGYHYLLKGDRVQAQKYLTAAANLDRTNPYILNNLELLATWSTGPGDMGYDRRWHD